MKKAIPTKMQRPSLVGCALLFSLLLGACDILSVQNDANLDDKLLTGLINATEIDVSSKVPGRIQKVYVRQGDKVEPGDSLVELKIDELDAKLRQATTSIDAAKAQLALAKKGARPQEILALQKQVQSAQAQVDISQKMLERMGNLLKQGALPQAQYDEVVFKNDVALNQLDMAKAKYDATKSGARSEELQALSALVQKGESVAQEIEIYKAESLQKSPVSAEVSKVLLHEGELANTGYPLVTLLVLQDSWASFALREDFLKDIRVGDSAKLYIPALDLWADFVVFHIAVMGDFATWRATSERNRFDLKSFEVKLRPKESIPNLRPGMTVRWDLAQISQNRAE